MLPDSKFFKVAEFACKSGAQYPFQWEDNWNRLAFLLCDTIRTDWGILLGDESLGGLTVISGYRTPKFNAELIAADAKKGVYGVASGSQHTHGKAADLRPVHGTVEDLHIMILKEHELGGLPWLGGIGIYPESNWVHVDTYVSPDGHLRMWTGV